MSFQDLREYVAWLEATDQLSRIALEVDPFLEIAEITNRVSKGGGGGKALWFQKVKGSNFPILTNLFGSIRRTARALGVEDIDDLAARMGKELEQAAGESAGEKLRQRVEAEAYRTRIVEAAPCREVIHQRTPKLSLLPALQAWPDDGGRFITMPLVFTCDLNSGRRNCGMYRVQIINESTGTIHFGRNSDGLRHYASWRAAAKPMPMAIAVGGDPALIYAATAPLPQEVEETAFAGFLRREPVQMTPCLGSDLAVPASAEFVIEGYLLPGETRMEGPFGNHTGYYVPASPSPLFHVTAITHRREPLFPSTIVGPPPMEDCFLAKATERLFLPILKIDFPEVVDLNFPVEGIFHGCALLSLRKDRPGQGKEAIRNLWRAGLLRNARLLVVFDAGVDVQNPSEAYWRAVNNVEPIRDVLVEGERLGIDATEKGLVEGGQPGRRALTMLPQIKDLVDARWCKYGIE